MIAAFYARKSTAMAALLCLALIATARADEQKEMTHEEYLQTMNQVTPTFMALYTAAGERIRSTEILQKCGYKKEADELDARTVTLEKSTLDRLLKENVDSGKVRSFAALMLLRESTHGTLIGYKLGYQESFRAFSDFLPARQYEALCKGMLKKANEWLKEDGK